MAHRWWFEIKYQVQRLQMRADHDNSKYLFHQQRYVKEFAVKFQEYINLVRVDDKIVIPVGELEQAISTGICTHNPSLGSLKFEYCNRCIGSWLENWRNCSFCHFICWYSRIEPKNILLWTICGDAQGQILSEILPIETWNRINSTNQKLISWNLCSF